MSPPDGLFLVSRNATDLCALLTEGAGLSQEQLHSFIVSGLRKVHIKRITLQIITYEDTKSD